MVSLKRLGIVCSALLVAMLAMPVLAQDNGGGAGQGAGGGQNGGGGGQNGCGGVAAARLADRLAGAAQARRRVAARL